VATVVQACVFYPFHRFIDSFFGRISIALFQIGKEVATPPLLRFVMVASKSGLSKATRASKRQVTNNRRETLPGVAGEPTIFQLHVITAAPVAPVQRFHQSRLIKVYIV